MLSFVMAALVAAVHVLACGSSGGVDGRDSAPPAGPGHTENISPAADSKKQRAPGTGAPGASETHYATLTDAAREPQPCAASESSSSALASSPARIFSAI